jgi:phosphinothricin acetyltransferase
MNFSIQNLKLKRAEKCHWHRIIEIYNEAILESGKTADTELQTVETRLDWLEEHLNFNFPILLVTLDNEILGWCSLSKYRPGRKALESTAEISYYIAKMYRGEGIGNYLISEAIKFAREQGIKNLIAILLDTNTASIRLLEKFDFKKWGHLPRIAEIDEQVLGQFIYGRNIEHTLK